MKLLILNICMLFMGMTQGNDLADYSGSGPVFVPEGEPLLVRCRVVEFDHIKWHVSDRAMTPGVGRDANVEITQTRDSGYLVSTLTINATRTDQSGDYRCTSFVDNSYTVNVLSAKIIMTNADEKSRILVLKLGKTMSVVCNSSTPIEGDGSVSWTKSIEGSQPMPVNTSERVLITSHPGGSNVTILDATNKDVGNYTCRFAGDIGGHPNAEATIQIATNASTHIVGKSINVKEDGNLSISCKIAGAPRPTVKWSKNGIDVRQALNESKRLSFASSDDGHDAGILKLSKLARDADAGDYCCIATNLVGTQKSCITVRVKGKLAALWPFIGIVAEVIILTAIIYIYEKKKGKSPDMDDSDTDHANDRPAQSKGEVRQRK